MKTVFLFRPLRGVALTLLALAAWGAGLAAQETPDIWKGALDTGAGVLRLELHVTKGADGTHSADLFSVDQGNVRIPVDSISIEDGEMTFELSQIGGAYRGRLNQAGTAAEGTWTQGATSLPLRLTKDEAEPSPPKNDAADPDVWKGTLNTAGGALRLELRVTQGEDGAFKAELFSVDQGNARIPVDSITIENGELKLSLSRIGGSYEGALNEAGTVVDGTWRQGANSLPLKFTKETTNDDGEEPNDGPGEAGVWDGVIDSGAGTLRLELHVDSDDEGTLSAYVVSIDQGNARIPVDRISIADGEMTLGLDLVGGSYSGKLNQDGTVAEGTWTQGAASLPLRFAKRDPSSTSDPNPEGQETLRAAWVGTLNAGSVQATMQFRVVETEAGEIRAYFDSITEGLTGFKAERSLDGDRLTFKVPQIRATYEGALNADGDVSEGKFRQGGNEYDLTLRKEKEEFKNVNVWENRPQRPRPPFPYTSDDLTFENAADGVTLAGTLTIPQGPGPFPAVVLISGSGPQDRDESLMEHKPFLVLADYLSRRGIAVLRYDDRGFGKSSGKFGEATSQDFARDASAALDYLKGHDRIAATRIGLVGHSEGGLIAPIVASQRADVAFIVLMAGPGVDGEKILYSQSAAMARAMGAEEKMIRAQDLVQRAAFKIVREATTDEEIPPKIEQAIEDLVRSVAEDDRQTVRSIGATVKSQMGRFKGPWFRYFLTYDPYPTLTRVTCPVLAINGERDLQVLADLNLPAIEKALRQAKNQDFEVMALEGLNHLFQQSRTGAISEYASIQETINPQALKMIGDWIDQRVGAKN